MSIKKTSILALSVLLSYESFAAPTVLATTPRLGASSSVASTGRGKATTSFAIGGGLNKLTSNRAQGSFTPNSAPTDKQNELIENFQKEIQNVRDAVAEELQAQNDKIKDLEAIIEEKDEKIAELEESIDEKIEKSGFITAENVRSDILTAKQEAVRQATNAAVKEVNSMGFAKTAEIKSEISTAKNAAIAQAKNEAVAEVNSMGFAKTATIESDILNAKNAAIELATTAALAEVESKGFATDASVQNLKTEIKNERDAALKSYAKSADVSNAVTAAKTEITNARNAALQLYATSAQLAADIDAAKTEITNARNTALESYATSADVSSAVAILATKEELKNLEVGVDEERLAGIIDDKLQEQNLDVLSEQVAQNTQNITTALSGIESDGNEIANIKDRLATEFVTSTTLTTYQGEVAGTIDTLATKDDLTAGKLAAVLSDSFVKPAELEGYATTESVNSSIKEIGDKIANDLLADPTFTEGVLSGLDDSISKLPTTVDELTRRVAVTEGTISSLGDTYATKGEVSAGNLEELLNGKFVKPTALTNLATKDDLSAGNLEELLSGKFVKPTALTNLATKDDLSAGNLEELLNGKFVKPTALTNLATKDELSAGNLEELLNGKFVKPTALTNLATKDDVDTDALTGKLSGKFVLSNGLSDTIKGLKDTNGDTIFVTNDDFGTRLTNADLSENGTIKGFDGKFALNTDLTKEITARETAISGLDSKFVPSKGLSDTIIGLKDTDGNAIFVTQTDVKKIPSAVIAEMQNSKSDNYIGKWTDSTGKNPLLVTQAELGTGVAKLFGETDETGLTKFKSTVDNLDQNAVTIGNFATKLADNKVVTDSNFADKLEADDTFKAAQAKVKSVEDDLATKADSADVVTKTSLSNELVTLANNDQLPSSIVTTGNFAEKLTANDVVTTSSLGANLYETLSAVPPSVDGACSTDPNGDLKNLLIDVASGDAEFGTCTATPARPGPTSE